MKKILLILVLIVVLVSCRKAEAVPVGPSVFFESPQPINDSELDHFPARFIGLYVDRDSTFLRIKENIAQYEYYYKFKIHKKHLDSLKTDFDLVNGKLIGKKDPITLYISRHGDSLELAEKKVDTIFRFSYYQKAKRIDGNLVLSSKDSIFWTVQNLNLKNDNLKLRTLYYEDIHKMDSITAIKSRLLDSTSYLFKPTRKEFARILKIKNLGYLKEFKKVKT